VLSISLGHGFPYGDVADCGTRLWVVTDANVDGDGATGRALAAQLAREFWDLRDRISPTAMSIDAALDAALATDGGPVVLADLADNPGGGAPGDSTFILRRVLERGLTRVVSGAYWDLGAVQVCREAGEGAMLDLRLGGKVGPTSGDPVDVRVTVRALRESHVQTGLGFRLGMGPTAWVEAAGGVHLVLCSTRSQVYGTDLFTGLGIDVTAAKFVIVKSTQHFHADFAPIASRVIHVDTPGAVTLGFDRIPFRVRDLDYWPRVADPYAIESARGR
jgi:microcystin degradation protein MlrC